MRRTWVIGLCGPVVLASSGLLAQETLNENAADKAEGGEAVAAENGAAEPREAVARQSPSAGMASRAPAGDQANRWRYRFHNGHWWYYGRGNQWSYWNGTAWTPYDRETYAQWFGTSSRSYDNSGTGRRTSGTVQRQKNEPRTDGFGAIDRRPAGFIQRQKNEARGGDFGSLGRRPPGTIQRQKNSPRGEE